MDADAHRFPPSSLVARIAKLFPALVQGSQATVEAIARQAAPTRYPAGTTIFTDQSPCAGFPLILSGTIDVGQRYANGRELQLYRVKAGESCLMSGSCLLADVRYAATGVAQTDVELLVLPPDAFRKLIAEDHVFRTYVFSLFGERLATLMALVEAIAFQKLDQRLAGVLVDGTRSGERTLHVTHQALANEIGSVREIVSRLLRSFEDRGYVKLGRARITVCDETALLALARG
ncbi:MAG: Crp/Fnr family transcriptional regulator [Burkholderiales bacterium]|nr:Crp/Fnr family transcriptional regulator [Burkholderiales bacterium]